MYCFMCTNNPFVSCKRFCTTNRFALAASNLSFGFGNGCIETGGMFASAQNKASPLRRNTTFGVSCIGIYKKVMSEKYSYAASAKVGSEIKYVTRFFFVSSILRRFRTSNLKGRLWLVPVSTPKKLFEAHRRIEHLLRRNTTFGAPSSKEHNLRSTFFEGTQPSEC